ncbi:glycerol-3-phosphate 1-O-acyltransferase PlsY [Kroppenstedtia pulmonis]|uniref:glycerol-3-phosphate 1-O-acyltransferase PlsY n=1 Tax=Kroppenstedtia pulmonis TaxID=1380685 RepID=UPI0015667526|nr:glycerol-3-phosphate 1-O-acyltransferase PlsY [Kroppenstedtia pulmonis]
MTLQSILAVLISYLLGSISTSYWITKLLKGTDIRSQGSGNAGATNMLRVVGKGPAAIVFILDMLKGMAAVGIASLMDVDPAVIMLSGLAAVVGHNWPIFLGFRGGKGIATTIGVMILLTFLAAVIAGVVAILIILLTRYVSLGSLFFAAILPLLIAVLDYPTSFIYISLLVTLLAFLRHASNIKRLINGTENKMSSSK